MNKVILIILFLIMGYGIGTGQAFAQIIPASGSDQCLKCHPIEVNSFLETLHAGQETGCAICHGGPQNHLSSGQKKDNINNPARLNFKKSNEICLACHQGALGDIGEKFRAIPNLHDQLACYDCHKPHSKINDSLSEQNLFKKDLAVDCAQCHKDNAALLEDSHHGRSGLTCADCHKLHEPKTISRDMEEQLERCLSCHPRQELEFKYPYTHPLRERQIKCADCHNPHSDRYHAMLKEEDDKTCGECHKDIAIQGGRHPLSKRTDHPFGKVTCLECHQAHGSNFDKILKYNSNQLCTSCHD